MNTQTSRMDCNKQKKSKRGAPKKSCPDCGSKCHARSSSCECGHIFFHKQLSVVEDWTMLGAGDKTYMGVYGRLIVKSVTADGILAYTVRKGSRSSTVEFVYMGKPEKWRQMDNYYRRPHKLIWDKKIKIR